MGQMKKHMTSTNQENLEKIIEISQKVEDLYPRFVALTGLIMGKKRVGIQFYSGEKFTEEYTVHMYGYSIEKYEKGLHNPFFVQRWQERVLDDYVKQEAFILAHPFWARARYFPWEVWKGNIRFGRE